MTTTPRARFADLPTLTHIEALPFQEVRLNLENGQTITLDLEAAPRLLFCPLPTQPGAVLLEDWKDSTAPAYHIPADLQHHVRAALHLCRVDA